MDLARYAELFLTESRDNLSAINHSLLELERAPGSAEHVGALFRAVHTVKGMSATMGYSAVAELSHELETLLDRVRRGEHAVTADVMDVLFAAADALERAIELSVAGRSEEIDCTAAVARLRALVTPRSQKAEAPAVAAPDGEGVLVRVRQTEDTPLRGVRAYLAVEKARTLGEVAAVNPPVEDLQAERFERDFALRVRTDAADAEIERAIRAAGHVERVVVDREGKAAPAASAAAPLASAARTEAAIAAPVAAAAPGGTPAPAPSSAAPSLPAMEAADPTARQHRHVRIDLQRLDTLMNLIGELVITRGRLVQLTSALGDPAIDETVTQASRLISDLQDGIMASRMVPVWHVFDRFPRVVRDTARALGKQIDFIVMGKEIELDRSMLDELGDPVIHLLRNAIDHGIESPEGRLAAGKPTTGRLSLSALRDRSSVVIRVSDDGRGIDRDGVLARAKQLGLVEATRAELSDEELLRIIATPGVSTAQRVTDVSGRGVGMDAVFSRVRSLGGTMDVRSVRGMGTTVTLRLPITLAIVRALMARVEDETYALPMTHVSETVGVEAGNVRRVKGREVFVLRGDVLPLYRLRQTVGLPTRDARGGQVVVLEVGERRAGLAVDELTGQQEIVVKPFDAVRGGLQLFSGATILGDGVPALILDVSSLL